MDDRKVKIIFDCSVIVTGYTAEKHHRTGLFRVSGEILKQLEKSGKFEIWLFDVFFREREVTRYVIKEFPGCKLIKTYSRLSRFIFFPAANFADRLRSLEHSGKNSYTVFLAGVVKNFLLFAEKAARKTEKILNSKFTTGNPFYGFDIFFSTFYPIPAHVRKNVNIRKVYTIHDLIPILHPEYFSSRFNTELLREVIDNISPMDYIITVSNSTKNDLLSVRKNLPSENIFVAYLAAAEPFRRIENQVGLRATKDKFAIPEDKKYFLSACTFEPRKNLSSLISAWEKLLSENMAGEFLLILSGAPYWEKDPLLEKIEVINNNYGKTIFITGFVSDEELAILYNGAYTFIYPSYYEGFGLPPLEAMKCGVPVICSDNSSLPEVVGDSGILTPPGDVEALANAIFKLGNDPQLRSVLSSKAEKKAAEFSWEKTSGILENVFHLASSDAG